MFGPVPQTDGEVEAPGMLPEDMFMNPLVFI